MGLSLLGRENAQGRRGTLALQFCPQLFLPREVRSCEIRNLAWEVNTTSTRLLAPTIRGASSFRKAPALAKCCSSAAGGKEAGPKPPTRVINLARNPATPLEALDTAARIERAGKTGGQTPATSQSNRWTPNRIQRGDWSAVNFLSPFLVEAYRTLSEATLLASVPTVPLSDLADIGPEGRRIRDAYTHSICPRVGAPGPLVSQDGRYAVHAGGDRRLH